MKVDCKGPSIKAERTYEASETIEVRTQKLVPE